jgi:hypothetical protein
VLGYVFKYAVDLLAVAFSIFILGLGVYRYFTRDSAMLWSIVGLVVAICMRAFCLKVSEILLLGTTPVPTSYWIELSTIIALSVIATVVVIFIMLRLGKRLDVYFKKEVQ